MPDSMVRVLHAKEEASPLTCNRTAKNFSTQRGLRVALIFAYRPPFVDNLKFGILVCIKYAKSRSDLWGTFYSRDFY